MADVNQENGGIPLLDALLGYAGKGLTVYETYNNAKYSQKIEAMQRNERENYENSLTEIKLQNVSRATQLLAVGAAILTITYVWKKVL